MARSLLLLVCSVALSGCVFGGSDTPNDTSDTDTSPDMGASDAANNTQPDLATTDQGEPDLQTPDAAADMDRPDEGTDMPADMPPPERPISAVCDGVPNSAFGGSSDHRLRVLSNEVGIFAGVVRPNQAPLVAFRGWSQWANGPIWFGLTSIDTLNNAGELDEPNITGLAVLPIAGSGFTDTFITRVPDDGIECLYGEFGPINQRMNCAGAWGAEATNTALTPRYFWFGEGGTIGTTPVDDFDPMSQQHIVPWCARDPASPTDCLEVSFGGTEARGNRGPLVLLSDAEGRAYAWNTVQNTDGTTERIDCTTPPTAPVPLLLAGAPVMFARADIVHLDNGSDILVHLTDTTVSLHPLGADLQPNPATDQHPSGGLRPHFEASSDGVRIAAVTAVNADARLFAFGPNGSTMNVVVEDDPTAMVHDVAVAIQGDLVAILAASSIATVAANAYTMWSN